MFKNKKLSRLLSLIAAFSVAITAIAGINVSAQVTSVANQSFFEDFEGYSDVTGFTTINGKDFAGGWKTWNTWGGGNNITALNLSTVESAAKASGRVFKMGTSVSASAGPAIYKDPNITIGNEDIIISGDVYIPEININTADSNQRVRFYVSRGQGTDVVRDYTSGDEVWGETTWANYVPASYPAFGLFFTADVSQSEPVWRVRIGGATPTVVQAEIATTNTNAFNVAAETWYNLCLVYHPSTGDVDYYIDGKYLDTHPTKRQVNGVTYPIPNLAAGEKLGNINLCAGGTKSNDTAAMFDNISVVTASAASNVKYDEIEKGTNSVFASWDIPVDITNKTATVKKLAANDVTFSGAGATDVTNASVTTYSNGVGVKFTQPLDTAFERYQIKVSGAKNVCGETVDYVYNFVVGDKVNLVGASYNESFSADVIDTAATWTTSSSKWASANTSNLTVSYDETSTALKIASTAAYTKVRSPKKFNVALNDTVDYVDMAFDLKADKDFQASVMMCDELSDLHAGIVLEEDAVYSAAKNGNYVRNPMATFESTVDKWQSYIIRYYPHDSKIEVYMGDTQETISDKPIFTAYQLYTSASGGNGTGEFKWSESTHGDSIVGMSMQVNTANVNIYLDNVNAASYSYSKNRETKGSHSAVISSDVIDGTAAWTTASAKWGSNATANLSVSYDGEKQAIKGTTPSDASYGKLRSPLNFNVPVNADVEYVDMAFDLYVDGATDFGASIMMTDATSTTQEANTLHAGFVLEDNAIFAAAGNGNKINTPTKSISSILGVWKSYKIRYYPNVGKLKVFMGDSQTAISEVPTLIVDTLYTTASGGNAGTTTYKWDSATDGNSITGLSIQVYSKSTSVYLKNVSAASFGYAYRPTVVKAAVFETAEGSMLDNKAGAKNINIYMANETAVPTVAINNEAKTVTGTNGVYEIALDTMLIGNTQYTLAVNNTPYTFTTGDGEFKVSNLRFEKAGVTADKLVAGDVITAKVDVYNSTEGEETPYLIWAAYEGDALADVGFVKLTAASGENVVKSADKSLTVTGEFTTVKAFIWDGIDTITPLLNPITINISEN